MKRAVIAFSGGLDSTTLLYSLLPNTDRILALFFHYGSLHNLQEYMAVREVLKFFPGIELNEIAIPANLFKNSGSALMGQSQMPKKSYEELENEEGPSPTVVPFRNGVILSQCGAVAASQGYDEVNIAVHATDHRNWAYPDCSPEFMGAMANAMYVGTYGEVRLRTPFIWMTKQEIVRKAEELRVPLNKTRSCYSPFDKACGECPTCVERIAAFQKEGWIDPIEYAIDIDWGSCEPWPHLGD